MGREGFWNRVYRKNSNFIAREIAGEIIIIPIKREAQELSAIYNLNNEVSVKIWKSINGKRTLSEIKDKILTEFDVTEQRLKKDLREFITDLEKIGAIKKK
jgi:hypothetical protein